MIKRMKWEYRVSTQREEMEALGLDGWELISVTAAGDGCETFFYKRPAPGVSELITLEQRDRVLGKVEQI